MALVDQRTTWCWEQWSKCTSGWGERKQLADAGEAPIREPLPNMEREDDDESYFTRMMDKVGRIIRQDRDIQCREAQHKMQEVLQKYPGALRRAGGDTQRSARIIQGAYAGVRRLNNEVTTLMKEMGSSTPPDIVNLQRQLQPQVAELRHRAESMADPSRRPTLQPDSVAQLLSTRLDQLHSALDSWRQNQDSETACRTVDAASYAFEEFRIDNGAQNKVRMLQSLQGQRSPWADSSHVKDLIRRRNAYILQRLSMGNDIHRHVQAGRYLEAEKHAKPWKEAVDRVLSPKGHEDWVQRWQRVRTRTRRSYFSMPQGSRFSMSSVADQPGILRIRNIRAAHLRSADVWDESDPKVVFTLTGQEPQATPVIWNNEENPEWRVDHCISCHHKFKGSEINCPRCGMYRPVEEIHFNISSLRDTMLSVELFDYDLFTRDDPLGHVDESSQSRGKQPGGPRQPGIDIFALLNNRHPTLRPKLGNDAAKQIDRDKQALKEHYQAMSDEKKKDPGPKESCRNQTSCAVHVTQDGTATCNTGLLRLKGLNAGDRGAVVEFQVVFDPQDNDPLVQRPEEDDQALKLVGQVDEGKGKLNTLTEDSRGFFLYDNVDKQGHSNSRGMFQGSGTRPDQRTFFGGGANPGMGQGMYQGGPGMGQGTYQERPGMSQGMYQGGHGMYGSGTRPGMGQDAYGNGAGMSRGPGMGDTWLPRERETCWQKLRRCCRTYCCCCGTSSTSGPYIFVQPRWTSNTLEGVAMYNQSLDILNVLTTFPADGTNPVYVSHPPMSGGGYGAATKIYRVINDDDELHTTYKGVLAPEHPRFESLTWRQKDMVFREFSQQLGAIRWIEEMYGSDKEARRFYVDQDMALPQVGAWSTARRQRLRDQVFKVNREVVQTHRGQKRFFWLAIWFLILLVIVALVFYFWKGVTAMLIAVGILLVLALVVGIIVGCVYACRYCGPSLSSRGRREDPYYYEQVPNHG